MKQKLIVKGGDRMTLDDEARKARNAYWREWAKKNPEKRKEYAKRYWLKKAQLQKQKEEEISEKKG